MVELGPNAGACKQQRPGGVYFICQLFMGYLRDWAGHEIRPGRQFPGLLKFRQYIHHSRLFWIDGNS